MPFWPHVIVATPAHSGIGPTLTYRSELPLTPGSLVRVPLGAREVLGVVWACDTQPPEGLTAVQTKTVASVLDGLPALNGRWLQLVRFAAQYYQRGLGEVALAALPPQLRELDGVQLARRLKKRAKAAKPPTDGSGLAEHPASAVAPPANTHTLSPEQAEALANLAQATAPILLFGATGSGKTEVYLQATRHALDSVPPDGTATQVLVMVPEIITGTG